MTDPQLRKALLKAMEAPRCPSCKRPFLEGISQRQVGREAGVNPATLSRFLRGVLGMKGENRVRLEAWLRGIGW